jgi:N-acetylneuraminic acid mutarotase
MKTKFVISGLLLGFAALAHGEASGWEQRATADLLKGRAGNTAVWTGCEMIVFGGEGMGVSFADGARYSISTDSWSLLPTEDAPSSRTTHSAVWTGREMIIWGGFGGYCGNDTNHSDGARFDPARDKWTPLSTKNAPEARFNHTAVWTGTEMLVWGGYTDSHSWYHGGHAPGHLNTGGRYNPTYDAWQPISTQGSPSKRFNHVAVWTGREMIVWGGGNATRGFNDGGRYDPATDTWRPMSEDCPLRPRALAVAVWAGDEMIVWGGAAREDDAQSTYYNDGARYNPETDKWTPLAAAGAPKGRIFTKAVWTGAEMVLRGGVNDAQASGVGDSGRYVGTGACYYPATDSWVSIKTKGAPSPRLTSGVWTGGGLLTFGGYNGRHLNDTFLYSP